MLNQASLEVALAETGAVCADGWLSCLTGVPLHFYGDVVMVPGVATDACFPNVVYFVAGVVSAL